MSSLRRLMPLASVLLLASVAGTPMALAQTAASAPTAPLLFDAGTKTEEVLQRLPMSEADQLFVGELAVRHLPIFVTKAQAEQQTRLQIVLSSAVSVLPERSHVTIRVNDQTLIEANVGTSGNDQVLSATVPAGLLVPGFNGIRIAVDQRHRVDCSIKGTYELWTRLDPARSGLLRASTAAPESFEGLDAVAAVPSRLDGTTLIRIRRNQSDLAAVNRSMRVVEALVLAGHIRRPIVQISDKPGPDDSLEVAVGTDTEGASGDGGDARRGRLVMPASGPASFTLSAPDTAGLTAAIDELRQAARRGAPLGSVDGVQALARSEGYAVAGETSLDFDRLGVATGDFGGRLYRSGFLLRLPPDFLSASYDHAKIQLAGTVARGLLPASRLTVWVNGNNVAGVDLAADGRGSLDRLGVDLPLGVFRPGLNDVAIEAELLTAGDKICDGAALPDMSRMRLLPSSTIAFPTMARATRLPDLAAALSGGDGGSGTPVYTPGADPGSVDTAATVIANMVPASGRLVGGVLRLERPPALGAGLVVAPLPSLPGQQAAALADLTQPVGRPSDAQNWAAGAYDGLVRMLERQGLLFGWADRTDVPTMPRDGMMALQSVEAAGPAWQTALGMGDIQSNWVIFTAPTAANLSGSLEAMVRRDRFHQLEGEVTAYAGGKDELRSASPRDNLFVQTQAPSWTNTHLFIAGMFSLNSNVFAGLLLLTCLVLGVSTRIIVRRSGVKP